MTVQEEYRERYDSYLQKIAAGLQDLVLSYVKGIPHIDRVSARAKHPDRFAVKAASKDENGNARYKRPLTEVQDQIGVRILVFYLSDVEKVNQQIAKYFQFIESKNLIPESEWEFGYVGHHFVIPMPKDVIPKEVNPKATPSFFELQIKTLFQHAWSEAGHDLVYKPDRSLSSDQLRRFAFTAAQAWGADRIFDELLQELAQH